MKAISYIFIALAVVSMVLGFVAKFVGFYIVILRIQAYFVFANTCLLLALVTNTFAESK